MTHTPPRGTPGSDNRQPARDGFDGATPLSPHASRVEEEEELRRSEERFRLIVESIRDYAIFMLDPDGNIATWNAGAERIKGYRASEIIGRHFSVFYPPSKVAEGFPQHELAVAAREGRFEDEGWRVRKDGSQFWANVVITALRDRSGELVGFAKVTRDLTERRAAEEQGRRLAAEAAARTESERRNKELQQLTDQLQEQAIEIEAQKEEAQSIAEQFEQANAELEAARSAAEEANRAKSQFLATMSHELRTPLNAIAGYADLLEMGLHGPITPDQRESLLRIRRSQMHLTGLINEVLNYARLESGMVTYDIRSILVADVVATVFPLIEPQRAAKHIRLDIRLPEGAGQPPIHVLADRDKLQQIVLNLLSNAIKFTPENGRVEVVLMPAPHDDGMALLRVVDTGIGIPTDKLEAIFEPFVQVGRSLRNPGEGTGLGLAISRDLARAMGGDITAASELGHGATFTVTLPAARDSRSS